MKHKQHTISTEPKKRKFKGKGRRKIDIKFIKNDRSRRLLTFSKRIAGVLKKIEELNKLTGADFFFGFQNIDTGTSFIGSSEAFKPILVHALSHGYGQCEADFTEIEESPESNKDTERK
jgi:hypothetical protein